MKKKYENPITLIVKLNGEAVCLLVGSSGGDGDDLVKEEGDWDDDLWDD